MSERIEQAVIAEQQAKISLGKALEEAIEAETKAEAALKEASAESAKARRAALRGGWDERSLRKLGLLKAPRAAKKTEKPKGQDDASGDESVHGSNDQH